MIDGHAEAADKHRPWLSQGSIAVLGTGSALPGTALSTEALVELLINRFGLTRGDEAMALGARMGIRTRHVARPFDRFSEPPRAGQSNPDLAAEAVGAALADAGLDIGGIGYLIGHTATPAQPLPSNIALAADRLGYDGPHLELRQACTGFANALMIAFGLLAMPGARPVAIVGSETGSLFFDPARVAHDKGQLVNMVQMGDGAAAIILGPEATGASSIHSAWFGSIGLGRAPGLQMHADGPREFDHDFAGILRTGHMLFDAGQAAAAMHGVTLDAVDTIVPHQVSGRIGELCAEHFFLPADRFFVNADRVGNTGSTAIWLALAQLRAGGMTGGTRVLTLGAEATKYMHGGFVYSHG